MSARKVAAVIPCVLTALTVVFLVSCGGGSSSGSASTGKVSVWASDPPTCAAPMGMYAHVYLTIKDVLIHRSATAGANDAGWIDLTPNLSSNPKQIDMFGQKDPQCFLASLGSQTEIQAGQYQQIRVLLSDVAPGNGENPCGPGVANCAITVAGDILPLQLSSESRTGIRIPSGQIAGGKFVVEAGSTVDLMIDFDACASLVPDGNGKLRLKPVLHGGEVQTTAVSINGALIDSQTQQPIPNVKAIVALEQKDTNNVDVVKMQVATDANGQFALCPVPVGTYDLVAVAVNTQTGQSYAATIIAGVQPGTAIGNIPMVAVTGANTTTASVKGSVTTTKGSATQADVVVAALQQVDLGAGNLLVTIPLAEQQSSTVTVTTDNNSCPADTYCAEYTLKIPAVWPNIRPVGSTNFAQSSATPVDYSVQGTAFTIGTANTETAQPNCTNSPIVKNTLDGGGDLSVTAGGMFTAATMDFTGCN